MKLKETFSFIGRNTVKGKKLLMCQMRSLSKLLDS